MVEGSVQHSGTQLLPGLVPDLRRPGQDSAGSSLLVSCLCLACFSSVSFGSEFLSGPLCSLKTVHELLLQLSLLAMTPLGVVDLKSFSFHPADWEHFHQRQNSKLTGLISPWRLKGITPSSSGPHDAWFSGVTTMCLGTAFSFILFYFRFAELPGFVTLSVFHQIWGFQPFSFQYFSVLFLLSSPEDHLMLSRVSSGCSFFFQVSVFRDPAYWPIFRLMTLTSVISLLLTSPSVSFHFSYCIFQLQHFLQSMYMVLLLCCPFPALHVTGSLSFRPLLTWAPQRGLLCSLIQSCLSRASLSLSCPGAFVSLWFHLCWLCLPCLMVRPLMAGTLSVFIRGSEHRSGASTQDCCCALGDCAWSSRCSLLMYRCLSTLHSSVRVKIGIGFYSWFQQ